MHHKHNMVIIAIIRHIYIQWLDVTFLSQNLQYDNKFYVYTHPVNSKLLQLVKPKFCRRARCYIPIYVYSRLQKLKQYNLQFIIIIIITTKAKETLAIQRKRDNSRTLLFRTFDPIHKNGNSSLKCIKWRKIWIGIYVKFGYP